MDLVSTHSVALFVIAIFIVTLLYSRRKQSQRLPNGPSGVPLLGNILDFRGTLLHLKLTEWSRRYGDFYSYKIGQSPVIVLSSPSAVQDLYIKRGKKYSSRPKASNQVSIITQDARIVNMPYGEQWRVCVDVISLMYRPNDEDRIIERPFMICWEWRMQKYSFHFKNTKADAHCRTF
jgi:hypothetical protein